MKNVLIIDSKLVVYYLFHRKETNLLKFTDLIAKRMLNTEFGNQVIPIFVMDKGQSKRVKIAPEYKAQRKDLIKKQGEAYEIKVKKLNEFYSKLENYLRNFGRVVAVKGLEADDLASVLTDYLIGDNLIYFTSDSDWLKFFNEMNTNWGNQWLYHLNRGKLLHSSELEQEFGYKLGFDKVVEDCFCGVGKENIKGLKGLGHKSYMKIYNECKGELACIKNRLADLVEKNRYKIPDKFVDLDEMFRYNMMLFKPLEFKDLEEDEQKEVKEQIAVKPTKSADKIVEDSLELFDRLYYPTKEEQVFYKLK